MLGSLFLCVPRLTRGSPHGRWPFAMTRGGVAFHDDGQGDAAVLLKPSLRGVPWATRQSSVL